MSPLSVALGPNWPGEARDDTEKQTLSLFRVAWAPKEIREYGIQIIVIVTVIVRQDEEASASHAVRR